MSVATKKTELIKLLSSIEAEELKKRTTAFIKSLEWKK